LLHWIDWETHQLYSENRGQFHSQWRATPSGSFMPVDYKEVELSNLTYSEFRRSIGVAKLFWNTAGRVNRHGLSAFYRV